MLLEFSEKVVGEVKINLPITEFDVDGIIVSALEGGSDYWMYFEIDNPNKEYPRSQQATKLLLDGKSFRVIDREDETAPVYQLTLEKLLKGIELNYQKRPWDNDKENWDAESADCILQYAVFGELIYG